MIEQVMQRTWQEFGERVGTAMRGRSVAPVRSLLRQAIAQVLEDASIDEVMGLAHELRTQDLGVRIDGRTPRQLMDALLVEILGEFADITGTVVEVRLPGRASGLSMSDHGVAWERERAFLRIIPIDALLELGERTRDMLSALYEVTVPATREPFIERSGDKARLPRTFERLLWYFYLTNGFTRPTSEWTGRPAGPGVQNTQGGGYMRPDVRGRFVREVTGKMPELLKELTDDEVAAMAWDYREFGEHKYQGSEPVKEAQHRAFLKLLWAYYERRCSEGAELGPRHGVSGSGRGLHAERLGYNSRA
jgi:hypothetical protein